MTQHVVIDDLRSFTDMAKTKLFGKTIKYIRTLSEAQTWLVNIDEPVEALWLDHDLGNGEDIIPFVDQLVESGLDVGHIYVHTSNPIGMRNIVNRIAPKYNYSVITSIDLTKWLIVE